MPTKLGADLERRVGRDPSRAHLAPVGEGNAEGLEAGKLVPGIVCRLALGHCLAELCDGSDQIALHHLCPPEVQAAPT